MNRVRDAANGPHSSLKNDVPLIVTRSALSNKHRTAGPRRWPRSRSHDSHLPLNASDSSLRWGGEYIERKSGGMKNIREFWDRAANSRCCAGLVIFNQMMPSHQLPFLPNTLKDYNRVCWYQRKKKSNLTCRTRLNSLKLAIKNSDGHLSHDRVSLSVSRQNSTRL